MPVAVIDMASAMALITGLTQATKWQVHKIIPPLADWPENLGQSKLARPQMSVVRRNRSLAV
jgi:hypothetical protein